MRAGTSQVFGVLFPPLTAVHEAIDKITPSYNNQTNNKIIPVKDYPDYNPYAHNSNYLNATKPKENIASYFPLLPQGIRSPLSIIAEILTG